MKIFVTGGTGFVGSHLARKLDKNHEVTVGGLEPENSVVELPESVGREMIDVIRRETLDFQGYDCVIHLVALSPLRKPPVSYRKVHVEGTKNTVRKAEKDGVNKYFHMSALGAEKGSKTDYLRTKYEAEKYVEESDLDWRIMKPSTIFGEGGQFLEFLSSLTTPFVTVLPGKNTLFEPIYIEDVVECIENSLQDDYSGEKLEIGGPEQLSLGDIARKIEKSRDRNLRVSGLPMPFFHLAMVFSERIPFSPFGEDQYYSLKSDNTTSNNDVEKLGVEKGEMKTLDEYLGID